MAAKLEQFPLSLSVSFSVPKGKASANPVEEALSSCSATTIAFWGPPSLAPFAEPGGRRDSQGIGIGCKDGSVFVLRSARPTTVPLVIPASSPPDPISPPTSPRRHLGFGRPSSRSASPSSTKSSISPFQVTRSRVVSSVTAEQAEAPKNYVDFEEEQERLKGMLRGKGHRDRHASTSRTRPERESITAITSITGSSLRKDDTQSYLSAALSPTSSTLSLSVSTPPSPTLIPSVSPEPSHPSSLFGIQYHAFPPHAGPGRSVSSLKAHDGGKYFTCLLEMG